MALAERVRAIRLERERLGAEQQSLVELRDALAGAPFRYFKSFMLIIESAMIYSAAILIEIVLYFTNSNAFYIIYDPIAQLTVRPPAAYLFQSLFLA